MRNTAIAITAFLLLAPGVAEAQDFAFSPASLPDGWTIERESVVPAAELPTFEARLGVSAEYIPWFVTDDARCRSSTWGCRGSAAGRRRAGSLDNEARS